MRAEGRGRHPMWPVVPAVAAGGLAAAVLGVEALAAGGLAIPAVAVVYALFLGAPLAMADWDAAEAGAPAERAAEGLIATATAASAGVAIAGLLPEGSRGMVAFAGAWAGALLLARFPRGLAVGSLGVGLWLVAGAVRAAEVPAWGLLEPAFPTWREWLPSAVALGALASQAPGVWERAPAAPPGRRALPIVATGVSLLGLLGAAVLLASDHERSLGAGPSPLALGLAGLAATAGAGALCAEGRARGPWAAGGAVSTLGFAALGPEAASFWWGVCLPVLLGAASLARASVDRRPVRVIAGLVPIGAVLAAFPGFPEAMLTSAAATLPVVAALWVAGLRALPREAA